MATCGGRTEIGLELPVRVYFQDTDAAGVVFHATYLDFMERARIEWLRARGFDPQELAHRFQLVFIVRELQIAYLRPALLDDLVTVSAGVNNLGRAQLTFGQEVKRGEELLARAAVNVACVAAQSLKPMPIPGEIRAALGSEAGSDPGRARYPQPRSAANRV